MPMTQKERSKLIKKMDTLFSKIVRKIGECERCGKTGTGLQCAHIVSRKRFSLRWDLENAICFCYACHIHWQHKEPLDFVEWLKERYGEDIAERLKIKSNAVDKVDLEATYEYLKTLDR